jgi:hypothetical protein
MSWSLFGAQVVSSVHLGWVLFTIFGAFFCFRRPLMKWVHLAVMAYGVAIELGGWICPLTYLEKHLLDQAGVGGYEGDFITHVIRVLIYPGVPQWVLIVGAFVVLGWTLYLDFLHDRLFPPAEPARTAKDWAPPTAESEITGG